MSTNSVKFHRVIKAAPQKVFRAFTDANALSFWMPPYGFLGVVHKLDARSGGSYRMSFINFSTGSEQFFGGEYLEVKPNEFIKFKDRFDDPNLPGEMTTSVWIRPAMTFTEIEIVQEGIPEMIPLTMCYLGWQESLEKLAKLVEPEIPDGM